MVQKKEYDKIPEQQQSETELDNILKKEFRTLIIKLIQESKERKDAHNDKLP